MSESSPAYNGGHRQELQKWRNSVGPHQHPYTATYSCSNWNNLYRYPFLTTLPESVSWLTASICTSLMIFCSWSQATQTCRGDLTSQAWGILMTVTCGHTSGCCYWMEYRSCSGSKSNLWDDHTGRAIFQATMSHNAFRLIKTCLFGVNYQGWCWFKINSKNKWK